MTTKEASKDIDSLIAALKYELAVDIIRLFNQTLGLRDLRYKLNRTHKELTWKFQKVK